jgi:hypothetical protein
MPSALAYAIVGQGRWGTRIHGMLGGEGKRVRFVPGTRQGADENADDYSSRMAEGFLRSGAQVAWLCVPPGRHVVLLIRAAIAAGLHLIVEKPWIYSSAETEALLDAARRANVQTAVDFEYCFLDEVGKWREEFFERADLRFGGKFHVAAADHAGIPALQNLGSHLLAMREFAAPRSLVSGVSCAYEAVNERKVWLEAGSGVRVAEIDFFGSKEPIVQRFLARFEASVQGREDASFPFDFSFGGRVKEQLEALGS